MELAVLHVTVHTILNTVAPPTWPASVAGPPCCRKPTYSFCLCSGHWHLWMENSIFHLQLGSLGWKQQVGMWKHCFPLRLAESLHVKPANTKGGLHLKTNERTDQTASMWTHVVPTCVLRVSDNACREFSFGKEVDPRGYDIMGSVKICDDMLKTTTEKQSEEWSSTRVITQIPTTIKNKQSKQTNKNLPSRKVRIWIGSKGSQENWGIFLPVEFHLLNYDLCKISKLWISPFLMASSPTFHKHQLGDNMS